MTNGSAAGASPSNRAVMIVLSYLWILAVVPLLIEKQDEDIQWHAKHGLVLLAAEIILLVVFSIVTSAVSLVTSGLGCFLSLLAPFIWLVILLLHIAAMIKGLNGQRLIVPGVSEYASRF